MRIGILGGGQLGRMIALAGIPLGFQFRFLDPEPDAPAAQVGELYLATYNDPDLLDRFADGLDVVTFEFENVPVSALRQIARTTAVYPPAHALETAQDRLTEKRLFRELGIPTPLFFPIGSHDDLDRALEQAGFPAVLKTRRFGYDGKGQWLLRDAAGYAAIRQKLSIEPNALILEGFAPFQREVSLIAARTRSGCTAFYPLVENRHEDGILRLSVVHAEGVGALLQHTAEQHVLKVMEALDYVGVMTLEFFQCGATLLANEIAPRVHNSGHLTIEAAETSQFENHLRAILGLPLGSTAIRGEAAMWNVLGSPPRAEDILKVPAAHMHLYGKEPRSGRKIGHITLCATGKPDMSERLAAVRAASPQS